MAGNNFITPKRELLAPKSPESGNNKVFQTFI